MAGAWGDEGQVTRGDEMRPLRYSINVTLDGCCHHEAGLPPDEESMRYWTAQMERADALLFGRVTYEMMESAWRKPATGAWPDWMDEWEFPFAEAMDRAKKYVVSNTLSGVDWNAELVQGDLGSAIQRLKEQPGEGLWVGGVRSEEHTSELQSLMRISYAVFCLKKKTHNKRQTPNSTIRYKQTEE